MNALVMINESCQSGGQYLHNSDITVAAVAVTVATKNVKDKKIKNGIISKTIKEYINVKKAAFDKPKFVALFKYAFGGLPADLEPDEFTQEVEEIKRISAVAAFRAVKQSLMRSEATGFVTPEGPSPQTSEQSVGQRQSGPSIGTSPKK